MLTASAAVDQRVAGLDLGADDYLCKPFAFAEVVARLRALRAPHRARRPARHRARRHALDPARRQVTRDGPAGRAEPEGVRRADVLLLADGGVVSAETLLQRVWDEHVDPFTNTVRVTLMNLRRKLGGPPIIETVIGTGYRSA